MPESTVEIDWVGRRVADLPRRTRRRLGWKRRRKDDRESGPSWLDALDLPIDGEGVLVGLVVIVALILGFLLWEVFVGAIVLFLLELFVLVPLVIAALAWRTVLRRPWRVVVRRQDGTEVRHVDVVGWLRARRVRAGLASQLAAGARPEELHVDALS